MNSVLCEKRFQINFSVIAFQHPVDHTGFSGDECERVNKLTHAAKCREHL